MKFTENILVRIDKKLQQEMHDFVAKNPKKYESLSHFLRCAAIKTMREEEKEVDKNAIQKNPIHNLEKISNNDKFFRFV